ncbi:hypothetical protein [Desulfoscipio geothermicus]|uniref:Uncharacterized protein n=1 Tax=Desulfoscipio geothermicus DSM 3669 TaxID=1121426 RepID=A0A1I6EGA4_9FIRM|nr:hypothetical protein [Desulfoscipio geothermicus]SFR16773.1 hypothetical protein SAMN05660706_1425 [Desulfoscipio geothermicus DSM 3669]
MGNLKVITDDIESQPLNENFANNCAYGVSSNGTDDYAITPVPAPISYIAGQMFRFKADVANTGACTLNVNTLGAKAIKMEDGSDPANGMIQAGAIVTVIYDGTYFRIPNSGLMSHLAESAPHQQQELLYLTDPISGKTYRFGIDGSQNRMYYEEVV